MNVEAKKLWEKVKENRRKLKSCSRHDFSIDLFPQEITKNWKCTRCGGIVDSVNKRWYEEGLRHASDQGVVRCRDM